MTALGDALKKHGINPNENEFLCGLTKLMNNFLNNGGTPFRCEALLKYAAERLSGEGQNVTAHESHINCADTRPPISAGHQADAIRGQLNAASAKDRDGAATPLMPKGQPTVAVPVRAHQRDWPKPKEPSKTDIAAIRHVKKTVAHSLWDRTIGGELRLRNSTKLDWINFARKFSIGEHICRRMVTEIAWPDDDKTPLEKVATEKQVKEIMESGPQALRMLESSHAA